MPNLRRSEPNDPVTVPRDANPEGWGWPGAAGKAHYFDGPRSLCLRWMYTGPLEKGNDGSKDNCVVCKRLLAARHIPADDQGER